MWKEFKTFISKGNMLDMAVGIIIGGAFSTIVTSLVNDILMPPLGILLGNVDFSDILIVLKEGAPAGPYDTLMAAQEAGAVTINIGLFVNALISFLIMAVAVFMIVQSFNRLRESFEEEEAPAPPDSKPCPFCKMDIPIEAQRCPHCTSTIE